MSLRPDGVYRCDRCDLEVGNASALQCAIITTLTDGGDHLQLHLCRQSRDRAPRGCAGHVLGPRTLAAYTALEAP